MYALSSPGLERFFVASICTWTLSAPPGSSIHVHIDALSSPRLERFDLHLDALLDKTRRVIINISNHRFIENSRYFQFVRTKWGEEMFALKRGLTLALGV